MRLFLAALTVWLCAFQYSRADISYSSGTYSQDFNSLAQTGNNNAWVNDTTIVGWHMYRQPASAPVAITDYRAGDGGSNAGSFWSFGSTSSSDRALGGIGSNAAYFGGAGSGNVAGWISVSFKNTSGVTLDKFTIGFNGEQWRDGGNTTSQTMTLQYGFGSTFAGVSTWNSPGGNFDWSSPVNTSTAAAVNGNVAGLVTGRGGTISNIGWQNNQTLFIRWVENNDVNSDHGLAIDDVSFSAKKFDVPEPSALLLIAGLAVLQGSQLRRRRRA